MTRPEEALAPDRPPGAPTARRIRRVPGIPGARAIVGGLLVALAGVGTFLSWQQATGTPDTSYAVADGDLTSGDQLSAASVRFVPMDLPGAVASAAFASVTELEGRVLVAPVGDGQLLQLGAVSDRMAVGPAAEVSITLARDLAVDGRLEPGDTVDVYATEDQTTVAAVGVRVVAVTEGGGSFGDGRELTVTLALAGGADGAPIIHAARQGQVTLVRTTHAAPATAAPAIPGAGSTGPGPEGPAAPPTAFGGGD